jgi:hypothetical protein
MMSNRLFAILISLILTACGGSGGSGGSGDSGEVITAPGPSNASFLTASPDTDEVGESQRFDLSGTASANGETLAISGSYSITRKPNEQRSSEEVIVYDVVLVLSIPSQGTTVSSGVTSYASLDGTFLLQRLDTGVECYPNDNYVDLPATIKIGENGVLGSVNCSDGMAISGSYLVEESNKNSAWAAVRVYATATTPGTPDVYEDIVWHYSEDGRIHALEIFASDNTISFELTS